MGDEFRANVKEGKAPLKEEERKNLRIALYSYQIDRSAYAGSVLGSGLVETKIQECRERLSAESGNALFSR